MYAGWLVRSLTYTLSASLLLSGLACQRLAWEAGKERRWESFDRTAGYFRRREAEGPERLERSRATIRKSQAYHEDHLQRTSTMVKNEWEGDKTRWVEEQPKRREFASRYWRGKPETIPTTWAKLVY